MKYICTIFFILFFSLNSQAFEGISIPQNNYDFSEENYSQKYESQITNQEFEKIERKLFKKTFSNEPASKRLSRLEQEIFGMEQKGDELDRFENILTACEYNDDSNILTENPESYNNYYSPKTLPQQKQTYEMPEIKKEYYTTQNTQTKKPTRLQKFVDDVIETFSTGTMTGYTPPLYYNNFGNFNNYYPRYLRNNYLYRNPYNSYFPSQIRPHIPPPPRYNNYHRPYNHYYGNAPRNFNTGAGVRIIK